PGHSPAYDDSDRFYSSDLGELIPIGGGYFLPEKKESTEIFRLTEKGEWHHWNDRGERRIYGSEESRLSDGSRIRQWYLTDFLDSTCSDSSDFSCNRIRYVYERVSEAAPGLPAATWARLSEIRFNFVDGTARSAYR